MSAYLIEIATNDFYSTNEAVEGGADRIELCASLRDGGITPSYGTLKQCRSAFDIPIFPIIRPRSGDFLYTDDEFAIMVQDVVLCKQMGFDGIVAGMLTREGAIDKGRMQELVDIAYPLEVTFHRAFDRCKDPYQALDDIISIGCSRILTSGQQASAIAGKDLIASLVKMAQNRIVIMPGGGVRKENIKVLAQETGATEFHSSLRINKSSEMLYVHPSFLNAEESYNRLAVDRNEVRALKKSLQ